LKLDSRRGAAFFVPQPLGPETDTCITKVILGKVTIRAII
jgi:hypothetical protein